MRRSVAAVVVALSTAPTVTSVTPSGSSPASATAGAGRHWVNKMLRMMNQVWSYEVGRLGYQPLFPTVTGAAAASSTSISRSSSTRACTA